MRHARVIVMIATVVLLVTLSGIRPRRIESNHSYPKYDATNEITVSGFVQAVENFRCPASDGSLGTHVLLQTDAGMVRVHLGPSAYVSAQDLRLVEGELVNVVGAKVRDWGDRNLIAREVVRHDGRYTLRDANGSPLWSK